jgi:hypothetical protein
MIAFRSYIRIGVTLYAHSKHSKRFILVLVIFFYSTLLWKRSYCLLPTERIDTSTINFRICPGGGGGGFGFRVMARQRLQEVSRFATLGEPDRRLQQKTFALRKGPQTQNKNLNVHLSG